MNIKNKWLAICHKNDLIEHSGVCALLENNEQVAIFKVDETQIFAVSNFEPIGKANVLYRGIIGDENGEVYVASPLHKQRYVLSNGICLDDDTVTIRSYSTRIVDDQVELLV